jgi:DHA1 family florfenicol/chloramphenicol resistance protein-like MFS transporter
MLFWGLREYTDATYLEKKERLSLGHALGQPTLTPVLVANFMLQFFYAWMVMYTPIYLTQYLGISWSTVGIIFTVMLVPFVLLDYPLGRLADKIGSEKEFTALGFLIMIACVLTLTLVPNIGILGIALVLFFSRVGAATVEAMTEIHFYKVASEADPRLLSVFSDLRPLAYILAPMLGYFVVSSMPFRALFGILGGLLSIGIMASFRMEREHTWWKRSHES